MCDRLKSYLKWQNITCWRKTGNLEKREGWLHHQILLWEQTTLKSMGDARKSYHIYNLWPLMRKCLQEMKGCTTESRLTLFYFFIFYLARWSSHNVTAVSSTIFGQSGHNIISPVNHLENKSVVNVHNEVCSLIFYEEKIQYRHVGFHCSFSMIPP